MTNTTTTLDDQAARIRMTHGILMAVTFVLLKPMGAILLRIVPRHAFISHVWVQMFAVFVAAAGVVLGIWLAGYMNRFSKQHPIIGFVVIGLVLCQPILGWVHHKQWLKLKGPTSWGLCHRWVGRTILALGIINGGIGLGDAGNSTAAMTAYIVLSLLMAALYITVIYWANTKSKVNKTAILASVPETSSDDP